MDGGARLGINGIADALSASGEHTLLRWYISLNSRLDIPAAVLEERPMSAYKPQRWKGFTQLPIRSRSRFHPAQD
jgi:hypothetical protein